MMEHPNETLKETPAENRGEEERKETLEKEVKEVSETRDEGMNREETKEEMREMTEAEPEPEMETREEAAPGGEDSELRRALEEAMNRVAELEQERWLMKQGIDEEELDYCLFRIGKLREDDESFEKAGERFLRQRRRNQRSTAAGLSGRPRTQEDSHETMNRLLRGR